MSGRLFSVVALTVWTALATLQVVKIASGHGEPINGAFVVLNIGLAIFNAFRLVAEPKRKSIRSTSTEGKSDA